MIVLTEGLAKLWTVYGDAELSDLIKRVSRIEWNLSRTPFAGTIWDAATQRMVTGTKVLCRDLVLCVSGEDSVEDAAVERYTKAKGVSHSEAEDLVRGLTRLESFNG